MIYKSYVKTNYKELRQRTNLKVCIMKLLFGKGLDLVFIGGTALNAFYLNYRYSEDLDLAYFRKKRGTK